jgi:hypothetical protein
MLDGEAVEDWCFEQLWLDPKHVVAIASHPVRHACLLDFSADLTILLAAG